MAHVNSKSKKADIYAEYQRLRKQVDSGKGTSAPDKKVWVNYSGVECKSQFTAYMSSKGVVRHLTGDCYCGKGDGGQGQCRALQKGFVTKAQHGSNPDAKIPAELIRS